MKEELKRLEQRARDQMNGKNIVPVEHHGEAVDQEDIGLKPTAVRIDPRTVAYYGAGDMASGHWAP